MAEKSSESWEQAADEHEKKMRAEISHKIAALFNVVQEDQVQDALTSIYYAKRKVLPQGTNWGRG